MIKKLIVSVLFFVATTSIAQQSTSSPYSLYGLGLENFNGTIANKSMAGLSLYSDAGAANLQNPASYSDLKLTTFGIGTSYTNTKINAEGGTGKGSAATLDYLAIAIPAGKFGFGFGIQPYRSVGYSVRSPGIDENGEFEEFLEGSGNVNRVYLGGGTEIIKGLKLGVEFQYNFGRLEEERIRGIEDVATFSPRIINQSDISGASYTFSGIYDYSIDEGFVMRSIIVYSASAEIKATNNQELAKVSLFNGLDVANDRELIDNGSSNRSFKLPSTLTAGLSFNKVRKWFLGGEAYLTNNNDYQDRFNDRTGVSYTDAYGVKGGGFYIPKFNSLTNYFNRISYRAGFHYDKLGLQINGADINEFGISFGFGLPLPREFSILDIGFEIGSRGQITETTIREDYFTVSLGLSLGQKWFKKRKYD